MLDNVGLRYPHRASGAKAPRTLRPLPLLRFAVSATGGAHLCSIQYYLRFWLGICRTSLAVSALRIMRYCLNSHRIAFMSFLWPAYSPWPALFWAASAYCLSLPFYKTQKAGRFIAASGPKLFIGCGWGKPAQPVYRVTFLGSTNGTTCATASCRVRGDWLLSRSISLYLRLPMPSSCM